MSMLRALPEAKTNSENTCYYFLPGNRMTAINRSRSEFITCMVSLCPVNGDMNV